MGKKKQNPFQKAVQNTSEISGGYESGLKALGRYSNKIMLSDPMQCEGSVDIDKCVESLYPQDSRWDYAIGYAGKAYFVEVHSADTGEVAAVEKKLAWLKTWLRTAAPELSAIKGNKPFYWIQSGKFDILKTSPQYKRVVALGLLPIARLTLPPK